MQALAQHFLYIVRSVRAALPHTTAKGGSSFSVVSAVVKRRAVAMAAPLGGLVCRHRLRQDSRDVSSGIGMGATFVSPRNGQR